MSRGEAQSVAEYNKLGHLKRNLGELLIALRAGEIASVVAFKLVDLNQPANAVQLKEKIESATGQPSCRDDASIISSTATVLNSPATEIAPVKQKSVLNESSKIVMLT